ncbi:MAG: hypothetical protein WC709_10500, partial [Thermoleophilia bacterium]
MNLRRRATKLCLLAGVLLLALGSSVPAGASPVSAKKARLRAVEARLTTLGMQVEMAVERYNQALARLETTKGKIAENRRLLTAAELNLERANRQLTARAQSIYKAPQTGFADVVFGARSFDDLVTQIDLLRRLGDGDVDLVHSIAAYEQDIKDRRLELRADERVAARLVAQRTSERAKILASEAR